MAHDDLQQSPVVGASVARLEDVPLVTGRGLFAADVTFPDALHMRVVRAPVAHGRIVKVDTSAARSAPGVVAVWTIDDIGSAANRLSRRPRRAAHSISATAARALARTLCRRAGRG